jgi:hypothetical protein
LAKNGGEFSIKIVKDNLAGEILANQTFELSPNTEKTKEITINLASLKNTENIYFLIEQLTNNQLQIDSFSFSK